MKIKALIQILLPVLLAGCLVGCENMDWYCIWGNGILEEETRELAEYDGVVAEGDFEVIYIPDTAFFMVVETDENLIPYIEDEILDNTLHIDYGTRKCLRPENPMRLYVYAPEVYLLSLVGSGKILAESIYTDELSLQIEGSGVIDITHVDVLDLQVFITGSGEADLRGTTETAQYHIIGSGTIDARHVTAEECLADISGSGTIYCHASEMLEAIISGSGNIYYRGYPEVHQDISGTGSVRRID